MQLYFLSLISLSFSRGASLLTEWSTGHGMRLLLRTSPNATTNVEEKSELVSLFLEAALMCIVWNSQ